MENLHISAGTVVRTLVLILAIINQILSACGKSPTAIIVTGKQIGRAHV